MAKLETQMGAMSEALEQILATLKGQGQQGPAAAAEADQAAAAAKPANQKSAGKGVRSAQPKAFAAPPPQGQRRLAVGPSADSAEAATKVMKADDGQPVIVELAAPASPSQVVHQNDIPTQPASGDAMQDARVGQRLGPDGRPLD